MKNLLLSSVLLLSTTWAQADTSKEHQISSVTVTEIPMTSFIKAKGSDTAGSGTGDITELPTKPTDKATFDDNIDKVGKIISTARDFVALGEAVYDLVQKGKPKNTTEYAPVSIVPKDPTTKEYVNPFDLENCSMPITRKFATSVKNGLGKEVVRFEYMIIYTVGCSYDGAGKYIQNAMIQPVSVKTSFGWEFNATMKLNGIMNHGTKTDPVAGAILTMKYQMNSWSSAIERNDTIHITGRGELKNY